MQFSLQLQPMNRGIDHTLLLSIAYQFCIVHPVHQLHFLMIFVQQFNSFLQLFFSSFVLVVSIFVHLTLIFVNWRELSCRCSQVVNTPTHTAPSGETSLIDLVLVSIPDLLLVSPPLTRWMFFRITIV